MKTSVLNNISNMNHHTKNIKGMQIKAICGKMGTP